MAQETPTKTLLVVEDEPSLRRVLEATLTKAGFNVLSAESGRAAVLLASANHIDLLLSDLIMPDMSGIEVLQTVREKHPDCAAIILTAYGTISTAVEAMRLGAFTYLQKPFDNKELVADIHKALAAAPNRTATAMAVGSSVKPVKNMIGTSAAIKDVYSVIERVARTRSSILILGESGTGKELVARAIHNASDRADKAFVAVSCAAARSELSREAFSVSSARR